MADLGARRRTVIGVDPRTEPYGFYAIRAGARRGPRDSSVVSMAWSPDGARIVLVRQFPADAHDRSDVDTIPAARGRERRHFSSTHFIGRIDWQPLG